MVGWWDGGMGDWACLVLVLVSMRVFLRDKQVNSPSHTRSQQECLGTLLTKECRMVFVTEPSQTTHPTYHGSLSCHPR